jgi:pyrimidine dimer DNA glycosylase
MRIWSVHPKYLDSKGLVAVWRETLLARKVLENRTKGYRNHPQLHRFKQSNNELHCINQYLAGIYLEAQKRNYSFDKEKIDQSFKKTSLTVTNGQLHFEMKHLKAKLKIRDIKKLREIKSVKIIEPHPLFTVIDGKKEDWEKT